jgi:hypothetical protein
LYFVQLGVLYGFYYRDKVVSVFVRSCAAEIQVGGTK